MRESDRDDHRHDHHHHDHHHHDHHHHDHHRHRSGLLAAIRHAVVPHSHDATNSIDDALEASRHGVRAVKVGLIGLGATAVIQLAIGLATGSVALLADTVHNASDALTAIPLWIAFVAVRRRPTRRYTYGYGRLEDLAGLFIVAMIMLSAAVAGYQSIARMLHPQHLDRLGWVIAAGVVGFIGNEAVAQYRIRVGRRIGSAALVADGVHARTDGFTSLAVVAGAIGVLLGFPLADPVVGIVISLMILVMLVGTARDVLRRLLDGIDPQLFAVAEQALRAVPGVDRVRTVRMRWLGHRLLVQAEVMLSPRATIAEVETISERARVELRSVLPGGATLTVIPVATEDGAAEGGATEDGAAECDAAEGGRSTLPRSRRGHEATVQP